MSDVNLRPWEKQDNCPQIPVNLTGDGLKIIQDIRKGGSGKANIIVNLKLQLNGVFVSYKNLSYKALYIG